MVAGNAAGFEAGECAEKLKNRLGRFVLSSRCRQRIDAMRPGSSLVGPNRCAPMCSSNLDLTLDVLLGGTGELPELSS